jgi:hypothetical protein
MADVQIAVRFRGETGMNIVSGNLTGFDISVNQFI